MKPVYTIGMAIVIKIPIAEGKLEIPPNIAFFSKQAQA